MPAAEPRALVIGIGNPERGDDAAGREAVRRLKSALPEDVKVLEHDGEPAALVALIDGAQRAVLVDACLSGAEPGTVRRFDVSAAPLPEARFSISTHGIGLAAALELARALGELPPICIVYAIEGQSFETGAALTPEVAAAVEEASERILAELAT